MLLVIDVGNTNVEMGIFLEEKLTYTFRIATNKDMTSDEIGMNIAQYFMIQGLKRDDVKAVLVSSVVPQLNYSITNAIKKYFSQKPLVFGEDITIDMDNRYGDPKAVGADRLITAYAAYKKYGGPLVVVDFGTATTFDVVDSNGAYLGGSIYPGLKISMDALVSRTAKLPRIEIVHPEHAIGKSTVTSMQSGIMYGYVGAVENIVKMLCDELGERADVIATGGLATTISREYKGFRAIDKTLILDGLKMIYDEYTSKQ